MKTNHLSRIFLDTKGLSSPLSGIRRVLPVFLLRNLLRIAYETGFQVSGFRCQFQISGFRDQKTTPDSGTLRSFFPVDSSSMTKSAKLPARWAKNFWDGELASQQVSELAGQRVGGGW
jgi:hypothetical protein